MDKVDYKKAFKELYQPEATPKIIDVPAMRFIQVDGHGDPNEPGGEYQEAVEILYALSYTIKMLFKKEQAPAGYVDYVVLPLEGLWQVENNEEFDGTQKEKLYWTSMIRQPDFVDEAVFKIAVQLTRRKKPHLTLEKARLVTFTEGLCVQCMHIGSFDEEPVTLEKMKHFTENNNFVFDLSEERQHHEIYLSDPRKGSSSNMKTVLRYPVRALCSEN
ncbi:GyrI-like domain-containing protein [Anaerocolumna xylanovorans]|uniref:GyrI-like small molecule binding domain-containing protein n=1 Tax=Anaerocolumna xylanovorans DSM 12503 TaxID=1121345 RepID=A0A1M7Y987_9FIRM|nr:GyrI-like domain-containing protein [Anaerocolumna xylanovorans]SHO49126.1 hypothetical protein SAMN02745217_02138 [Anaerocolumna xylanovorans DSM 12503]